MEIDQFETFDVNHLKQFFEETRQRKIGVSFGFYLSGFSMTLGTLK